MTVYEELVLIHFLEFGISHTAARHTVWVMANMGSRMHKRWWQHTRFSFVCEVHPVVLRPSFWSERKRFEPGGGGVNTQSGVAERKNSKIKMQTFIPLLTLVTHESTGCLKLKIFSFNKYSLRASLKLKKTREIEVIERLNRYLHNTKDQTYPSISTIQSPHWPLGESRGW